MISIFYLKHHHKTYYSSILLLLTLLSCKKSDQPHDVDFYKTTLFHEVQMQSVFNDSKTFVDCVPNAPIATIVESYQEQKKRSDFVLKEFVLNNFSLPERPDTVFEVNHGHSMFQHIDRLWPRLTRQPEDQEPDGSLIALPQPYVVPGGRFAEVYYWDSYFTMLGLKEEGRTTLIKGMLDNFAFLIDSIGHVPNGNRSYYLSRSQPPFFTLMVALYGQENDSLMLTYLTEMEKEYAFWMDGITSDSAYRRVVKVYDFEVNRYWDDTPEPRPESYKEDVELAQNTTYNEQLYRDIRAACESGWDFSSRWMTDPNDLKSLHTTEIIPVDLNCLLYFMEMTLARCYQLKNQTENAVIMKESAAKRKAFVLNYCWDEETGFFYDYDFVANRITPNKTLAGIYPLFVQMATEEQAKKVLDAIKKDFLFPGGVVTTLSNTGQQWDAPNGWAPLQWVTVKGLYEYGYFNTANLIAERWLAVNEAVFTKTGKMMEKYNVTDTTLAAGGGEYPSQDGFGWTNGVAIALKNLLFSKTIE